MTLKQPRHPNRLALDTVFGNQLLAIDIADFILIRPQNLQDIVVIVVRTLQTLRINSTDGVKSKHTTEIWKPTLSASCPTTRDWNVLKTA
jgi:hypothetical protein